MYQMPVKAIKRILGEELQKHRDNLFASMVNHWFPDAQREIINTGFEIIRDRLESCGDYESLDSLIGEVCRMSLQEWIDSL